MTIVAQTFTGQNITAEEWATRWPNFIPDEMRCKGYGDVIVDPEFMDMVQALRDACGFALPVSSGYRGPEYNEMVSSTGRTGPHTGGKIPDEGMGAFTRGAIDIKVSGARFHTVLRLAMALGFTGIGVSQKGPHESRFIHLDNLPNAPGQPRPTGWSY